MKVKTQIWYEIFVVLAVWQLLFDALLASVSSLGTGADGGSLGVLNTCIMLILSITLYYGGKRAAMIKVQHFAINAIVISVVLCWWGSGLDRDVFSDVMAGLLSHVGTIMLLFYARSHKEEFFVRRQVLMNQWEEMTAPVTAVEHVKTESPKLQASTIEELLPEKTAETVVPSPSAGIMTEKVDVNTCTADDLANLPGISAAVAGRIVQLRKQMGGFSSVDDFIVQAGIKPHFAVNLLNQLTVSAKSTNKTEKSHGRKLDI